MKEGRKLNFPMKEKKEIPNDESADGLKRKIMKV